MSLTTRTTESTINKFDKKGDFKGYNHISSTTTYENEPKSLVRASHWEISIGILKFVLCFILIFLVTTNLFKGADTHLTFTGFLNWLSSVKVFSFQFDIGTFTIGGNWGLFEGIRIFFDTLSKIFGVGVWLCGNLISLISFLAQFIAFIFAG